VQPVDPFEHADVRRTRQYGQLRARDAGKIAGHAATEQPEHLHDVLGLHDVGVADDKEGRGAQRPDVLGRPSR
jgi:hypothetical protein